MIDWTFVLIALHGTSATAVSVGFETESICIAYAKGALSRPALVAADIQTAQCVSLRTGRHIDFRPPPAIVHSPVDSAELPRSERKRCGAARGCYVVTHDELISGLRAAHNAGRRSVLQQESTHE